MKRVLYITNIPVPYRVRFFNLLAEGCELTVLYERARSANRDRIWTASQRQTCRTLFLKGLRVGNEFSFSPGILRHALGGYDKVIFGCFNSPVQQLAMLTMRLLRRPYYLNFDGEPYLRGDGVKGKIKRFLAGGAAGYLTAGTASARSVAEVAAGRPVVPYYFSSLTVEELAARGREASPRERGDHILVVGQYFDYKGLDVALEAARMDQSLRYQFVGMGSRTEEFRRTFHTDELPNVELIPFLQREALEEEYRRAALLVLPSRQECWGLVINEAAAFGLPIVSTWGSGAAVEFLGEDYPQYLAQPGDPAGLLAAIRLGLAGDRETYGRFLREKSGQYSLERSAEAHLRLLEDR